MRLFRRAAAFRWIAPRFAARSSALFASPTASAVFASPAAIASRARRTAVRAAERPRCFTALRRAVWRMRLSDERFFFLAAIVPER